MAHPSEPKNNDVAPHLRIMLRPLGSALPLGFLVFGTGTVLAASLDLHWIPPEETRTVALILLSFVAPLELAACIFGYLSRDGAGGTTMGIFSASWVAYALFALISPPGATSAAMGVFFAMLTGTIIVLGIVAIGGKPMLAFLLFLAALRSLFTVFHQAGLGDWAPLGTSVIGLILGAFSLYGGLAFLLEDVRQETILPVFRRATAKTSLEGDLHDQIERIHREAGVRQQL